MNCPLERDVDYAMKMISAVLEAVDKRPLRSADGRSLSVDTLVTAIVAPLYDPSTWLALDALFTSVLNGDPEYAFTLADAYNGREADGSYATNGIEVFRAVTCLDNSVQSNVETMRAEAAELTAIAPVLGPYLAFGDLSCLSWPFHSVSDRVELTAPGAAPILVIGTTGDPATPYAWAVSLAEQLESGVLLTAEGQSHTAYRVSNTCVSEAVDTYLIDGDVPAEGTVC